MATLVSRPFRTLGTMLIDFALPPRCAGCSTVIEQVGAFCPDCWAKMDWLGDAGCRCCGLPLAGTDAECCARCLAEPPRIDRIRAAVAYDEMPRSIALRLKYGRKVALARTMVRYMEPLRGDDWPEDALIVPVPLHRRRLWGRGFNQSALVASHLGRLWRRESHAAVLRRVRATVPLKGMNVAQRRKAVAGAFAVAKREAVDGRTVVLIDDIFTSGSTGEACAKALRKAGARRIELICWARVVRPSQLMR